MTADLLYIHTKLVKFKMFLSVSAAIVFLSQKQSFF